MAASEGVENEPSTPSSYIFVRLLGSGAFGEAILYQKTEDNSLVVWKEVNLNRLNEKQRKDSQGEIDILSLLNHANIISYYNHFVDDDTLFIEMEYANGGTLYDKIVSSTKLWPEKDVVWYLFQLTSALAYIHQYGIIHRDIKTLNIFLTKVGLVKLGDFGISRFLESQNQMAETIVGTPYYMSPEIMMGEKYNFKSDIWALGCVLYEMLTLSKTFEATNPLKLAIEVVKSNHSSIHSSYTDEINSLVNHMLCKKPEDRPTAEDLLLIPLISASASCMEQKVYELNSVTRRARLSTATSLNVLSVVTSKMCEVYQWGGGKITQKLDLFTREKSAIQVCTGHCHFAAITFEKELYTWANPQGSTDMAGRLGHGDTAAYKAPKRVDSLIGIPIEQVACGEDFTLCVTDEGTLYAFGSDYYGCLGCEGEEEEVLSPVPVDFFSDHPVLEVSCGDSHVMALTRYGDVYTWGQGEFGRLGLGSEDDYNTPQRVEIPGKQEVKHIHAGGDSSFLICSSGRLLACGSNQFNKLGFNAVTSGLRRRKAKSFDIPCRYTFGTVKPLSHIHISQVAAGKTHSGVIDIFGCLYMFGSNAYGQLGVGDFKPRYGISRVWGVLAGQRVDKLACGDSFTVVATNENQVYSWGNGENGRLGTMVSDQGKGPNGMSTSLPRPIFGSMHVVSALSCQHWNTIIIAEKVLNQKTVKSGATSPKLPSFGNAESFSLIPEERTDDFDETDTKLSDILRADDDIPAFEDKFSSQVMTPPDVFSSRDALMESTVPAWLKQELNDAEVIPFPTPSPAIKEQPPSFAIKEKIMSPVLESNKVDPSQQSPVKSPDLKLFIPSNNTETIALLTERISLLQEENAQLKLTIQKQEKIITDLKGLVPAKKDSSGN